MFTNVNLVLTFCLVVIWFLVIFTLLLIFVGLFCRYIGERVLNKSKRTKYSIIQIEEGRVNPSADMGNSGGKKAHKEEEATKMLGEEESHSPDDEENDEDDEVFIENPKRDGEKKPEKQQKGNWEDAEETGNDPASIDSTEFIECNVINTLSVGNDTEKPPKDDNETVLDDTETFPVRPDTTRSDGNNSQNVPDLKDSELLKSTENSLSRPVPTPRKKIKPGESQSELSASKTSLTEREVNLYSADTEKAKDENKVQDFEGTESRSISPRTSSPLWDELEAMFPLSTEIDGKEQKTTTEVLESELSESNEEKILNPNQEEETEHASHTSSLYPAIEVKSGAAHNISKSSPEETNSSLKHNKSLTCTSKPPPLPTALPKRGRLSKKSISKDGSKACAVHASSAENTGGQDIIHIEKSKHQDDNSTNRTETPELELKITSPKLGSKEERKETDKTLPETKKGTQRPKSPPPVSHLPSSPKEGMKKTSIKRKPSKPLQSPSSPPPPVPVRVAAASPEEIIGSSASPLMPKVSGQRKIPKPGHPPPTPPQKKSHTDPQDEAPVATDIAEESETETVKLLPFTPVTTELHPIYDEIDNPRTPVKKTGTDSHVYDVISDKPMVPKMPLNRLGDLTSVVQNASTLLSQRQILKKVSLGTEEFVNPVYESAVNQHSLAESRFTFDAREISRMVHKSAVLPPRVTNNSKENPYSLLDEAGCTTSESSSNEGQFSTENIQYITAVASTGDTPTFEAIAEQPEYELNDSIECNERQPLRPPVPLMPQAVNGDGSKQEASDKPYVSRKLEDDDNSTNLNDRQPIRPKVALKPNDVNRHEMVGTIDSNVGEKKKPDKPPVPRKPARK